MVQPAAVVHYERVQTGSQLVQRLEGLDYRVHTTSKADTLPALALETRPLVILADLASDAILPVIRALSQDPALTHVPVIGFAPEVSEELETRAREAGIRMSVPDAAVLQHLKPLLDQALHVE